MDIAGQQYVGLVFEKPVPVAAVGPAVPFPDWVAPVAPPACRCIDVGMLIFHKLEMGLLMTLPIITPESDQRLTRSVALCSCNQQAEMRHSQPFG